MNIVKIRRNSRALVFDSSKGHNEAAYVDNMIKLVQRDFPELNRDDIILAATFNMDNPRHNKRLAVEFDIPDMDLPVVEEYDEVEHLGNSYI